MKLSTLLNAIGGFILATIIAFLLVGGIDLAAAAHGLSDFERVAITVSVASACFTLRGIARQ
jgi:hypothetical protein